MKLDLGINVSSWTATRGFDSRCVTGRSMSAFDLVYTVATTFRRASAVSSNRRACVYPVSQRKFYGSAWGLRTGKQAGCKTGIRGKWLIRSGLFRFRSTVSLNFQSEWNFLIGDPGDTCRECRYLLLRVYGLFNGTRVESLLSRVKPIYSQSGGTAKMSSEMHNAVACCWFLSERSTLNTSNR